MLLKLYKRQKGLSIEIHNFFNKFLFSLDYTKIISVFRHFKLYFFLKNRNLAP